MKKSEKHTFTKSEILDMVRELGLVLASSDILLRYRDAEKSMAADPEARRLTRVFKEKHRKLAALSNREDATREEIEKCYSDLEDADKTMKANPLVNEYYKAGKEFNTLLYQINQLLKFYTMDDEESKQFESPGGCSGCSGCK